MRQQKYLQWICFPPPRVPAYQYFFRNGTIYNSQSLLCCLCSPRLNKAKCYLRTWWDACRLQWVGAILVLRWGPRGYLATTELSQWEKETPLSKSGLTALITQYLMLWFSWNEKTSKHTNFSGRQLFPLFSQLQEITGNGKIPRMSHTGFSCSIRNIYQEILQKAGL